MRLARARVTNYKSIDDSGWVTIDDVTCLVGKNESGKTAFLHALRRLNPVSGADSEFDIKDYPRKGYAKYKRYHADNPEVVVRAEFELSPQEVEEIESAFGPGALASNTVTASKDYANRRSWDVELDENAVVRHILSGASVPLEVREHLENAETCEEMYARLQSLQFKPPVVSELLESLPDRFKGGLEGQIIDDYLEKFVPRFVYFDDYSAMRGRISVQDLAHRRENGGVLDDADRTFLSLLSLVGADLEDLQNETNYEHLKADLEAASINISDEIFAFWNQNSQLRVDFDLSAANPSDHPPLNRGTILHVRIWNNRHRVSVPFDERSKGFVWFFSFTAYFSKLEEEEEADLILLLDEPGLNLHAMAQHDFVSFIERRLAPKHQVMYTTHSPFMINLEHLSRVRTVQDLDDQGTSISDDVFGNDHDTVFPLQVALGYQMAQTLFLAPHCLLVNSPADLIYMQVLGETAAATGRLRLDPRWVVIPVGGADNLPSFVSLLGENYVSVAVLMDVIPTNKEQVEAANRGGAARARSPIKWVEVTKVRDADIEDLFDSSFYLKLVNEAYEAELPHDLTLKTISSSNPRIVKRIEDYFEAEGIAGGRFDRYRPAAHLLQNHEALRDQIDGTTIDRASSLFERLNGLLPDNGAVIAAS